MIQGINQLDDLRYIQSLTHQLSQDLLYMNVTRDNQRPRGMFSWIRTNREFPDRSDVYRNRAMESRMLLESAWRSFLMYYKDTIDPMDPEIKYIRETLDKSAFI